jgi:hypothetical protein
MLRGFFGADTIAQRGLTTETQRHRENLPDSSSLCLFDSVVKKCLEIPFGRQWWDPTLAHRTRKDGGSYGLSTSESSAFVSSEQILQVGIDEHCTDHECPDIDSEAASRQFDVVAVTKENPQQQAASHTYACEEEF